MIENRIINPHCLHETGKKLEDLGWRGWDCVHIIGLPTHSVALEWLRINANIWIEIYRNQSGFGYIIQNATTGTTIREIEDDAFYPSPKDATDKALERVLCEILIEKHD
jgi:hypothetical protein